MPKYSIEGTVYDAASPDEAYSKHENAQLMKAARTRGAQMSPLVQGALTAAQGATFNFADELAGLAGPQYREQVRGATQEFARQRPLTAAGLELAGGLATAPFTGGLSVGRGITTGGKVMRTAVDAATQGALSGAGAAEEGERMAGAGVGALTGAAVGGGAAGAGGVLQKAVVQPAVSRMTAVTGALPESVGGLNVRPDYARERLAELLERDAQARIMTGVEPGQEAVMAAARLKKVGKLAPIASAGSNTLAEIDMLSQLPGTAARQLSTQQRKIAAGRGEAISGTAEKILGIESSAEDELLNLGRRQAEAAGPLYKRLETVNFKIDDDLKGILDRAKLDLGAAQRTATRRGEVSVPLRKLGVGDELPFASADQLKRSLWDKAEAARRAGRNNEAADLDRLRLDLVGKLDSVSPDYAKARKTFAGFAELQTAVDQGRKAFGETSESLSKLTAYMTPSELEAFRVGAVDSLRQVAGSQAGQTRLLNMYKEPELQGKLRAIFGDDFRSFQRTILAQEELKKLERTGAGSQTFKRLAQAQDQADAFDALQAAQGVGQAISSPQGLVAGLRQFGQRYGMPEEQRNRLARLLMLQDVPAQSELQNMQEYMRRRAAGQALSRQAAGRVGAFGAAQE
jgi:hypothetical protein